MIPDEAVEAAHRAWREQAALDGSIFEYNLRAALEAAAPHLMAAAWDEGLEVGEADWCLTAIPCGDCANCTSPEPENPYRKATK